MLLFLERISEFVNVVQPKKITQRHVKKGPVGSTYILKKELETCWYTPVELALYWIPPVQWAELIKRYRYFPAFHLHGGSLNESLLMFLQPGAT